MAKTRVRLPIYPVHRVSPSDPNMGPDDPSYPPTSPVIPSTTFDARGVTLHKGTALDGRHPVILQEAGFSEEAVVVWIGGYITSLLDPETTLWDDWHDQYGFISRIGNIRVVGTEWYNTGDGFLCNKDGWELIGCKMSHIHDDAVENDNLKNGLIDSCLIDGVQGFLSHADYNSNDDGTGKIIEIRNSMIRLKNFTNSYNPGAWYGPNRHGGFFKESAGTVEGWNRPRKPTIKIRNCIFRSDEMGYFGGAINPPPPTGGSTWHRSLAVPENTDVQDVMLIGTEEWHESSLEMWTSQATGIRYGTTAHWDYHKALWHPGYVPDLDAVP